MDKSCSGINVRLKIKVFLTLGGTRFCSSYRTRRLRKSIVSTLGSVAVVGALQCGARNGGIEVVICEGNTFPGCVRLWWWVVTTVLCPSRKGEAVTVLRVSRCEYVLDQIASSPGWKIHVVN